MKSRWIWAIALGAMSLLPVNEALAVSNAGGISLQFPIGARYNALGEAGTALSTDVTAMWWNVGGFAFAGDTGADHSIHFMYSKLAAGLADDVSINWVGYGQQVAGWGMLGASLTYLNQGEQTATEEETGNVLGQFNSSQYSINVTLGTKFSEKLGLGIGMKYFRDDLAPDEFTKDKASGSGSSWAVDLGVHYKVTDKINLGASYANLGPDITFVNADQADPMPQTLRFGAAYSLFDSEFSSTMLVVDYLKSMISADETQIWGYGVEWGYVQSLFVRFGYKSDPEGSIEAITAGGGVDLQRWTGQALTFDYASVPQADDLERVHRFSMNFLF